MAGAPDGEPSRGSSQWWRSGLPGAWVVTVATLVVLLVAVIEASRTGQIGRATDITLVAVAALAGLATRRGDFALVVMMPPLAFLVSVIIAGQLLIDRTTDWRSEQILMLLDSLGRNAAWVVGATGTALLVVMLRHSYRRSEP